MNDARKLKVKDLEEKLPEMCQRFRIEGTKPIGERSGMGAVWKAYDTWLERDVAIKISNFDLKDEISFCRDIDGHTVRIYDYFVKDGWQAYTMELLDDHTYVLNNLSC